MLNLSTINCCFEIAAKFFQSQSNNGLYLFNLEANCSYLLLFKFAKSIATFEKLQWFESIYIKNKYFSICYKLFQLHEMY
jgi:hypothetical protein